MRTWFLGFPINLRKGFWRLDVVDSCLRQIGGVGHEVIKSVATCDTFQIAWEKCLVFALNQLFDEIFQLLLLFGVQDACI